MNKTIWMWVLIAIIVIAGGWYFYSKTSQPKTTSFSGTGTALGTSPSGDDVFWGIRNGVNQSPPQGRVKSACAHVDRCVRDPNDPYNPGYQMWDCDTNSAKWCRNQCSNAQVNIGCPDVLLEDCLANCDMCCS